MGIGLDPNDQAANAAFQGQPAEASRKESVAGYVSRCVVTMGGAVRTAPVQIA